MAWIGGVIGHAEKRGIILCLEMLNRDDTHPMKGHPGGGTSLQAAERSLHRLLSADR